MVSDVLVHQVTDLKMTGIRDCLPTRLQQARRDKLGHDDFLSLILQDEIDHRRSARIKRLLKRASLRHQGSLEEIDFAVNRGLDKALMNDMATCRFVLDGINAVILGPTGVGKTHLASALGNAACRQGHTTLFYRVNSLIEQFLLARAKGTYLNLLKRLAAADLLILDDFGIKPMEPQQYQDFYDVIDERGEDKATIVTSQVPIENWGEVIADPVTCEAITDRLTSVANKIIMKGSSYRPKRGKAKKLDKV